jgi:hypothetical protein
MRSVKSEFRDEEIILDFHEYQECIFVDCVFVYHGFTDSALPDCQLKNCRLELRGPAALTLRVLGGFRKLVPPATGAMVDELLRQAGAVES